MGTLSSESVRLSDAPPVLLADLLPAGHVVVVGGPGSGKTTLLEALLGRAGSSGLLLARDRYAAIAAADRLLADAALPPGSGLGCTTWSAFAAGLVRGYADALDFRGEPRILSGTEQWSLVRDLLQEGAVDWGDALGPLVGARGFTDEVARFVLSCERRLLDPDDLLARAGAGGPAVWRPAAAFLATYQARLGLEDSIDLAGLVVAVGDLLGDEPAVAAALVQRAALVLVDEAQALDPAQLRVIELLAAAGARVVAAGDPAGVADPVAGAAQPLEGIARTLPASVCRLENSRRLGGRGLDALRRLQSVDPAAVRLAGGGSTAVEVAVFPGAAEEAAGVARTLRLAHQRDGLAYGRMAVLLAAPRRMLGTLRRELDRLHVPVDVEPVPGGLGAEPVVREVLDLFRLALDPAFAADLLGPLLTSGLGGLGLQDLRAVRRAAAIADLELTELVERPPPGVELDRRIRRRLAAFQSRLCQVRGWVGRVEADQAFWAVWRLYPVFRRLVGRAATNPADRRVGQQLDALAALSRALGWFVDGRPGATIATYLDVVGRAESVALPPVRGLTAAPDAVRLLPVDAAAGREFDLVVVAGCADGVLPRIAEHGGVLESDLLAGEADQPTRAASRLAAERRRFALALSRARDRVVLSYAREAGRGRPSRFLTEIGLELVEDPPAGPEPGPLTGAECVALLRRTLADPGRPSAERLAAATTLAAVPSVDPNAWWWRLDWTRDPEPIAAGGALRSSYSKIHAYEDCPLRYFYSTVAGLDDRSSYQMAFGKLMHSIFERAAKGEVAGAPEPLKAAFREGFDRSWFPSRAIAHQYWRDGMAMLRLWHQGEARRARRAVALETDFEIQVGRHTVRGRIDRVDRQGDGIALLDYKTSRYPASEQEARQSLQLAIYHLAALRDPRLLELGAPVEMQLVYPAKEQEGRFKRVAQRPGPGQGELSERRLLTLLEDAAREDFDPNPHADCRMCDFKLLCPLWPQGEDLLAPPRPVDGVT